MGKEFIKQMLRENLFNRIKEVSKEPANDSKTSDEPTDQEAKMKIDTLTSKIRSATQGDDKLLKLSQVMDKAGLGDAENASDRSKYAKKVANKKDADGKIRTLDYKEANAMSKVIDNPNAYN